MRFRLSSALVPVTAWVMAAVLACKIAALMQMAWADDRPAAAQAASAGSIAQSPVASQAPDAPASTPVSATSLLPQPAAPTPKAEEQRPTGNAARPALDPVRASSAASLPPDWQLLQGLRHQRELLDKRSAALDAREAAMAAAQHALEQRLAEIEHRQAELASLQSDRQAQEQTGLQGLVKLYEDMRPPQAAAIFDALDLRVLLPLLDKMNERKAAAIMGAMQPERARFATQALAKYRIERALGPAAVSPNPS